MRGSIVAVGAAALSFVAAHDWPNCETDNCYRNFIDLRYKELGEEFCVDFLAATTTAPEAIPTEFGNCQGKVSRVSSACSCITYSISTTTSDEPAPPTSAPELSSSEEPTPSLSLTSDYSDVPSSSAPGEEEPSSSASYSDPPVSLSSEYPGPSESASLSSEQPGPSESVSASLSSGDWTTSTIYTTQTRTLTDCPPEKTACTEGPILTTETIAISTTVCPVSSDAKWTTSTIYETKTYTLTDCPPDVECPGGEHVETTTIAVSTTVCPVDEPPKTLSTSKVYETEKPVPSHSKPHGTGSWVPPTPTDSEAPIPSAAGVRVEVGVAAVVGAFAAALL